MSVLSLLFCCLLISLCSNAVVLVNNVTRMNIILIVFLGIVCLLLSLAVEAIPDILCAVFRPDKDGKHSAAQRVGLYIAATITAIIVIWAVYHATTEMNTPRPYQY